MQNKDENNPPGEISMAKLAWACRRGMLELDVLLSNFLREAYSGLSVEQKERFAELLSHPDPALFSWLLGHQAPPEDLFYIVEMIRAHAKSRI